MNVTRRKTAYRIGLDTDETVFKVTVEWLFEMDNPIDPTDPFQKKENTLLRKKDFTEDELVALETASQCIHDCIERKTPITS